MTTEYETRALPQNVGKQTASEASHLISSAAKTQNSFLPLILEVRYG